MLYHASLYVGLPCLPERERGQGLPTASCQRLASMEKEKPESEFVQVVTDGNSNSPSRGSGGGASVEEVTYEEEVEYEDAAAQEEEAGEHQGQDVQEGEEQGQPAGQEEEEVVEHHHAAAASGDVDAVSEILAESGHQTADPEHQDPETALAEPPSEAAPVPAPVPVAGGQAGVDLDLKQLEAQAARVTQRTHS